MTREALGDDLAVVGLADNFPSDRRRNLWIAAVDLAIEKLNDFRPAEGPPHFRRADLFAIVQDERVRERRIGVGLGFIVVRVIAIRAGRDGGDVKKVHEVLVVLLGAKMNGGWIGGLRSRPVGKGEGFQRKN